MRVRDINVDMAYADCNGNRLTFVEPVVKEYAVVTRGEPLGKQKTTIERVGSGPTDPWGGCRRAKRPQEVGLRAKKWRVDRDGAPESEDSFTWIVIDPRDVKGTWLEYLVLYGDDVRDAADQRESEARRRESSKALGEAVRARFAGIKGRGRADAPSTFMSEFYDRTTRTGAMTSVELVLRVETPADFDRLMELLGVNVPEVTRIDVAENLAPSEVHQREAEASRKRTSARQ